MDKMEICGQFNVSNARRHSNERVSLDVAIIGAVWFEGQNTVVTLISRMNM